MRTRGQKIALIAPLAIVGIIIFIIIGGTVVMLLWNWLAHGLLGLPLVTFWQALGILVLCRILFGGFGCGGRSRGRAFRKMNDRWEGMTPEEREECRQRLRERLGAKPRGETTPR